MLRVYGPYKYFTNSVRAHISFIELTLHIPILPLNKHRLHMVFDQIN